METEEVKPTGKNNKILVAILIFIALGFIINALAGYLERRGESTATTENTVDVKKLNEDVKVLSNRMDALEANQKTVANTNK
jgi:hypothetical protein